MDITGESQEEKGKSSETALSEVEEQFGKRGIIPVGSQELDAALTALKLVPANDEDRTKAKFKELADYLKVRYVVTGTIHESRSERRHGLLGEYQVAQAKVQFRVFDASSEHYVEEMELTATATARDVTDLRRANKLRLKAVRDATGKAMAAFLQPYPKANEHSRALSSRSRSLRQVSAYKTHRHRRRARHVVKRHPIPSKRHRSKRHRSRRHRPAGRTTALGRR